MPRNPCSIAVATSAPVSAFFQAGSVDESWGCDPSRGEQPTHITSDDTLKGSAVYSAGPISPTANRAGNAERSRFSKPSRGPTRYVKRRACIRTGMAAWSYARRAYYGSTGSSALEAGDASSLAVLLAVAYAALRFARPLWLWRSAHLEASGW